MTPLNKSEPILFDVDIESALCGAIIIDGSQFIDCTDVLPHYFHDERNQHIWQAVFDIHDSKGIIDYLTVVDMLRRNGKLDDVTESYITSLFNLPSNSGNALGYKKIVKDYYLRRKLLADATQQAQKAVNLEIPLNDNNEEASAKDLKKRFELITDEEMIKPLPPVSWIVDNLISVGSVNCFYGDGGVGKTRCLNNLSVCVSHGKNWLNMATVEKRVLWLDEEGGNRRTQRWFGEAMRGEECSPNGKLQATCINGFKADNKEDCILLENLIKANNFGLCIIDVLAAIMVGDENSKEETQPVFTNLKRIAEATDCAIILIHHSNKSGGYRGTTAIKDAVDLMVQVEKKNGSNIIKFKEEKNRDGQTISFIAEANWGISPFDDLPSFTLTRTVRIDEKPKNLAQQFVLEWITNHQNSTIRDVMENADICSPQTARTALYDLARLGDIHRTNTGKVATYSVTAPNLNTTVSDVSNKGSIDISNGVQLVIVN